MTVDAKVQIGLSTDFLEGVGVDTPAGTNLFREGVVISDPDVSGARAKITNAAPAADAYGLAVRVIGGVVVGSEVEIKNDSGNPIPVAGSVSVSNFPATQPVSGTVALDSASLAALETISVANFPATQAVSATDLDIRNLSSAQDSVTVTGSVTSTVSGTVEITNDAGNAIPVSGTVAVTDGGGSLTVDGTVAVSNHPASQSVVGSGAAATAQRVQLADESLAALESITATVSGTVTVAATDLDIRNLSSAQDSVAVTGSVSVSNFPATQAVSGTVALDSASLAALETISVANFPVVQQVSGTVSTTPSAADTNVTGTWAYAAGTAGTVTLPAGSKVLQISATSLAGGSFTVNGGSAITIPANQQFTLEPRGNLVAPTLVFTSTTAFVVEYVS